MLVCYYINNNKKTPLFAMVSVLASTQWTGIGINGVLLNLNISV